MDNLPGKILLDDVAYNDGRDADKDSSDVDLSALAIDFVTLGMFIIGMR
jgi:hypothetical protein